MVIGKIKITKEDCERYFKRTFMLNLNSLMKNILPLKPSSDNKCGRLRHYYDS